MSTLHPTQLSAISKIILEERLQEAEQSRRLAAITPAHSRPWLRPGGLLITLATLALLAFLLGACGPASRSETAPAAGISEITIKATEHIFQMPYAMPGMLQSIQVK